MTDQSAALTRALSRIRPADAAGRAAAQRAFDAKTKPRGSLGRLEELAARIAGVRGFPVPARTRAAAVVAAADHGVAAESVSAYPQEVTAQMLANFAAGGAAINVLAREAGARLIVVDAGVAVPFSHPDVRSLRFGPGTANATQGPAMSRARALEALDAGVAIAEELRRDGFGIVAIGEMGIGNTTSAAALCACLLPADAIRVCGRGTGIDDSGLERKIAAVTRSLAVNSFDRDDPVGVLAALGGFEIALLVGVILGAAAERLPVILDGFITGSAALVAARLAPASVDAMIAAHRSPEPGHDLVLGALGLVPVLDLDMRLGEGSGAALALPLITSAVALLTDMATFADAGVTDAGR
jgi:nicotinate-nucleotide--dimethylbenzimidazole phosphoribosyltransferase